MSRLVFLVLLLFTLPAYAQTQLTDSDGNCWNVPQLGSVGVGMTLAKCNGSVNQSLVLTPEGYIAQVPWNNSVLREDTLAFDVTYSDYPEHWAIVNGYVTPQDVPGKVLLSDANGNPQLVPTPAGSWQFQAQTPPPHLPAGPLLIGVQAPQDVNWHIANPGNPVSCGGAPGQTCLPGPDGEAEAIWTVPQDYAYWETTLGYPVNSIASSGDGIAICCGWTDGGYEGSDWTIRVNQFASTDPGGGPRPLWLNIPPFPGDVGATLAQAGTGVFDAHYIAVAQQLVNGGYTSVVFRPIWEFEGSWYPWGWQTVGQPASYCTDFIAAFRDMVKAIRTVMPNAQFVFNAADGTIMPNWQACYPGDDVVDWVAIDTYDGNRSNTQPASTRWANDQVPGITSSQALALAHKKGWAVPEFAIGKMGDNPLFIQNMVAAARAYTANGLPAFLGYWNNADPNSGYSGMMDGPPDPPVNPLSWAAFIAASPAGAHQ